MYSIERLSEKDYHRGYPQLLEQLTVVGNISYEDYCTRLKKMEKANINIFVMAIEDKIVACGSVLIEKKMIHNLGLVGHIEDVVVDSACRGLGLGKKIIKHLTEYAKKRGCYKVILDCERKNVGFYVKCGYHEKGVEMAIYF